MNELIIFLIMNLIFLIACVFCLIVESNPGGKLDKLLNKIDDIYYYESTEEKES